LGNFAQQRILAETTEIIAFERVPAAAGTSIARAPAVFALRNGAHALTHQKT
jgi:hypothetical protein